MLLSKLLTNRRKVKEGYFIKLTTLALMNTMNFSFYKLDSKKLKADFRKLIEEGAMSFQYFEACYDLRPHQGTERYHRLQRLREEKGLLKVRLVSNLCIICLLVI